jgi:hypothetical protein
MWRGPVEAARGGATLKGGDHGTWALSPARRQSRELRERRRLTSPVDWRDDVRARVRGHLSEFVAQQCLEALHGVNVDVAARVLSEFLDGGKCVRSTFMYLGWPCGGREDEAALRASAHVSFGRWQRERGLTGSSDRFGESAAVLLSDLCLGWGTKHWTASTPPPFLKASARHFGRWQSCAPSEPPDVARIDVRWSGSPRSGGPVTRQDSRCMPKLKNGDDDDDGKWIKRV